MTENCFREWMVSNLDSQWTIGFHTVSKKRLSRGIAHVDKCSNGGDCPPGVQNVRLQPKPIE